MYALAVVSVVLVAALHAYFLVLEMFLWTRPFGRRVFGSTLEFAQATKTLAANQGLYNGFLAAGLIWAVTVGIGGTPGAAGDAPGGVAIASFFLTCVVVAGVYGAVTVGRKILFVQALPAAIALLLVSFARA